MRGRIVWLDAKGFVEMLDGRVVTPFLHQCDSQAGMPLNAVVIEFQSFFIVFDGAIDLARLKALDAAIHIGEPAFGILIHDELIEPFRVAIGERLLAG